MVFWSSRRGARPELPRLRPRVAPTEVTKVDFTELVPEPVPFLGQAAYIQLEFFESLSTAVIGAPSMRSKEGLSAAAGVALRRHHELIAELRHLDVEPEAVMVPFAPATDRLGESTAGADWHELLLGVHVTSGMLDDYFSRLAAGLPTGLSTRVRGILAGGGIGEVLDAELRAAIAAEPGLADRLALWGRSIVGDTLLIARSALRASDSADRTAGDRVEPVFTELIAEHTRRMDALGLTA
ncbi:ferritin-like fold-containing protein [Agromyces lapidis]|uniref:Ferritin-like fold-containing protein n=1 Tax=Agromyces lapidis TaxID=279574 RepID=A0ABV5SQX2_9MICO|nr:ferritin-like fold-containing protein [Agromyces lapidis]